MKLVQQKATILSFPGQEQTFSGPELIEIAGRTCYKTEEKRGCSQRLAKTGIVDCCFGLPFDPKCTHTRCPEHTSPKFFKMLVKRGHVAMIEHDSIIIEAASLNDFPLHRLPPQMGAFFKRTDPPFEYFCSHLFSANIRAWRELYLNLRTQKQINDRGQFSSVIWPILHNAHPIYTYDLPEPAYRWNSSDGMPYGIRLVRHQELNVHEREVHGRATVHFKTNRGVGHELVRHEGEAAFGQESTRYVRYDGDMEFILPVWDVDSFEQLGPDHSESLSSQYSEDGQLESFLTASEAFINAGIQSESFYAFLLGRGWQPQQAREILPNALKTELVMTTSLEHWKHIFNLRALRSTGPAHPQMEGLMRPLYQKFQKLEPEIFTKELPEI